MKRAGTRNVFFFFLLGLEMLVFVEGGKLENSERNPRGKPGREPATLNVTGPETNPGDIARRR